jgi:hypothetical protein
LLFSGIIFKGGKMDQKHHRAVEGDEVWVALNHVNADKWEEHKDFVLNILIPAAEKIVPTEMANTRFLVPDDSNEDGTFTSIFLMDPVIRDGNYDILDILKKEYGEEQAEQYFKRWVVDQVGFNVKQSPW